MFVQVNDMWPMLQGLGEERIGDAQNGRRNCVGFGSVVFEVAVMNGKVGPVLGEVDQRVDQTENKTSSF
jgi:hypothetical protein